MTADPTIAAALERRAALFYADPAIVHGNMVLSWGEFEDQAARLAAFLAAHGIEPGARVAIGMHNHPLYLVAVFATLKIHAVPVNVNHRYKATELRHVLADSGASALVHDSALTAALAEVKAELPGLLLDVCTEAAAVAADSVPIYAALSGRPLERGAPARNAEWLLYTGGTTGLPKPVVTSQHAILDTITRLSAYLLGDELPAAAAELDKVLAKHHTERPVVLIAPPLMHATGIYGALAALLAGGAVVLLGGRQYDPAELAAQIPRNQVTHLFIVGDAFALPLAEELDTAAATGNDYDLSSLRRILSVGTIWSASVKRRLLAHADVTLRDTIAATEGGPFALAEGDRSTPAQELTAFRLTPGARLIAPDGSDVLPGAEIVGMLAAPAQKGTRYANNPDKTSTTFRWIDGRLYAMPGDLARMNPDGTLRLLGRGSGVIDTGGEKVFTAEVEEVLLGHPAVTDAVVVGIPHPRWGTMVAAVVSGRPGQEPEPDVLIAHVGAELADYKKPRHIVVVDKVMRTISGKPDLKWAREVLSGELPQGLLGLDERLAGLQRSHNTLLSDVHGSGVARGATPAARQLAAFPAGHVAGVLGLLRVLVADAYFPGGWLRSGDIGHLDSGGYLTVTGRLKDIIVRGGEKISAKEVEDVLLSHPAVAEAALIGAPDDRYGERACAFVVLRPGASLDLADVRVHFAEAGLARQKTPERLVITNALPRTASGKVQKFALRDLLR